MKVQYGPYSPSRLDTAVCQLRFAREYILRDAPKMHSPEARRGNVVHETFEEITKGWIHEKPLEWEEIEKIISELVVKYKLSREEDIKLAVTAARAYLDNPPEGLEHVTGTEENLAVKWDEENNKFEECSWDDPKCVYRGKIDILMIEDTVATVIDHKTQPKAENSDTFQLGFYAWLVKQFYPFVTQVNTILHFCRPELNFYSRPTEWSLDDINELETVLKIRTQAIESIDVENAEPNPNYYCNYCSVNMECPKIDELNKYRMKYGNMKNSPIVDASEVVKLAEVLTVVDEGRKVLNSKIQKFAENVGNVVVHNKEYGYKPSKSWEVTPGRERDLWTFLEQSGIDPMNFVKFDIKALSKFWYSRPPSFGDQVKEFLNEKVTTRFGSRKVK